MIRKNILILESDSLLITGIQQILSLQDGLRIYNHQLGKLEEIYQIIEEVKPEVILIDDSIMASYLAAMFLYLQAESPSIRTILVNARSNRLYVNDSHQTEIENIYDFIGLLST